LTEEELILSAFSLKLAAAIFLLLSPLSELVAEIPPLENEPEAPN
jgi:hypothetical protein